MAYNGMKTNSFPFRLFIVINAISKCALYPPLPIIPSRTLFNFFLGGPDDGSTRLVLVPLLCYSTAHSSSFWYYISMAAIIILTSYPHNAQVKSRMSPLFWAASNEIASSMPRKSSPGTTCSPWMARHSRRLASR